jgi:hypothetical protein
VEKRLTSPQKTQLVKLSWEDYAEQKWAPSVLFKLVVKLDEKIVIYAK